MRSLAEAQHLEHGAVRGEEPAFDTANCHGMRQDEVLRRPKRISEKPGVSAVLLLLRFRTVPTVLRVGPDRFFFYSGDRIEPPHVHVERGGSRAKVWLDPVRLQERGGFRIAELARILELVRANEAQLLRAWDEYFSD